MIEENIHINPDGYKNYPQPDVPVEDAWLNMESMLNSNMPNGSTGGNNNKKGGGNSFWQSILVSLGVVGTVVLTIFILKSLPENKQSSKTQIEAGQPSAGSGAQENILATDDSLKILNENKDNASGLNNKNETVVESKSISNQSAGIRIVNSMGDQPGRNQKNGSESRSSGSEKSFIKNEIEGVNVKDVGPEYSGITEKKETKNLSETDRSKPEIAEYQEIDKNNSELVLANSTESDTTSKQLNKTGKKNPVNESQAGNNQAGSQVASKASYSNDSANKFKELNLSDYPDPGQVPSGPVSASTISKKPILNNISIGLQWDFGIPFHGTDYYSYNYQGNKKPFMYLIPGVLGSKTFNRHEIMLRFFPYRQFNTGTHQLQSIIIQDSVGHDSIHSQSTINNINLLKSFGFTLGLHYNFELTPSFMLGAGIDLNNQNKALQQNQSFDGVSGELLSDSLYGINKSSGYWQNFNPVFFTGNIEIAWRRKSFDIGTYLQVPLTNLTSIPDKTIKPVFGQVFFRWKIK